MTLREACVRVLVVSVGAHERVRVLRAALLAVVRHSRLARPSAARVVRQDVLGIKLRLYRNSFWMPDHLAQYFALN